MKCINVYKLLFVELRMNELLGIGKSKISGMGLFATQDISAEETICFMKGKEISINELEKDNFNLLQIDKYIYIYI